MTINTQIMNKFLKQKYKEQFYVTMCVFRLQ